MNPSIYSSKAIQIVQSKTDWQKQKNLVISANRADAILNNFFSIMIHVIKLISVKKCITMKGKLNVKLIKKKTNKDHEALFWHFFFFFIYIMVLFKEGE